MAISNTGRDALVFHSTRTSELSDIILKGQFRAGSGGGAMLGKGFYANLHLFQAQKHNYGPLIVKAKVYGLKKFFIWTWDSYQAVHGTPDGVDETNFREKQWIDFGGKDELTARIKQQLLSTAPDAHISVWQYIERLPGKPLGLVYEGRYDGKSLVCWYPKQCVRAEGVSHDDGKTWQEPDRETLREELNSKGQGPSGKGAPQGATSQHVSETLRSDQRALDLKARYEGRTDAQKIKAIQSHVSRIANHAKKLQRIEALKEAFPELDWNSSELSGIADSHKGLNLKKYKVQDVSSAELKKQVLALGLDPEGKSVKELQMILAMDQFAKENPGKEFPDQFDPMLAKEIKADKDWINKNFKNTDWLIQRKANGMRSLLQISVGGTVTMTSRAKSVKTNMFTPHQENVLGFYDLKSPFTGKTVLDGELISAKAKIDTGSTVTTSTLQATVALVHMNTPQSLEIQRKEGSLRYTAFDILFYDGKDVQDLPFDEREELLNSAVKMLRDENTDLPIEVIESIRDYTDAYDVFEQFIERGEEGIILRNRKAKYQQGKRTSDITKLKGTTTIDLFISGFTPATEGRGNEGLIGGFELSAYVDGKSRVICAVSNITDETRRKATQVLNDKTITLDPHYEGKVVQVVGQEFTKNGKLVHARIDEWRPDKSKEECKLTEKEIQGKEW